MSLVSLSIRSISVPTSADDRLVWQSGQEGHSPPVVGQPEYRSTTALPFKTTVRTRRNLESRAVVPSLRLVNDKHWTVAVVEMVVMPPAVSPDEQVWNTGVRVCVGV